MSEVVGRTWLKCLPEDAPANCKSPAVYFKSCTDCGKKSQDTFKEGKVEFGTWEDMVNEL